MSASPSTEPSKSPAEPRSEVPAGVSTTAAGGYSRGQVLAALRRFRVIAYVVGAGLLVLALVAMPLKYLGGEPALVAVVGPVHGFLYVLYLLATLDLAIKVRWSLVRTVAVMVAGTIPFLSFVAERRVSRDIGG